MADKEKRIWIEFDIPKPKGAIEATRCTTMTRQEAIERMAKAAKKAYRGYFYTEPHHPNISDIMEAALNALLEDKK